MSGPANGKQGPQAIALLDRAIEVSGLSARHFAEYVLLRDERVLRRWRHGHAPVPYHVAIRVADWLDLPPHDRNTILDGIKTLIERKRKKPGRPPRAVVKCPACGSRRVYPTEGNAVGNTMDCSVCGNDFTPPGPAAPLGSHVDERG